MRRQDLESANQFFIASVSMARDHRMRTFIVDSFTDTPFKGNPAGVCMIGSQLSDERMLHIAQELNLSETAFLSPLDSRGAFAIGNPIMRSRDSGLCQSYFLTT
jgi:Phenazine biosynthesis-like protein